MKTLDPVINDEKIINTSDKTIFYRFAQGLYRKLLRGKHSFQPITIMRFRLFITAWAYLPLLTYKQIPLFDRFELIARFIYVDWNVIHAHRPQEIVVIVKAVYSRGRAGQNETFIEAGSWNGGSSAKFSILCEKLGYTLHIFDSFEGVEKMSADQLIGTPDFSGKFSTSTEILQVNLKKYGEPSVCHIHKGWFIDTLVADPFKLPVRFVYIDCDLAKGTSEVLQGILPRFIRCDGVIFSQDYHIKPVREMFHDPEFWSQLGVSLPNIKYECHHLARITFRN